MDDMQYLKTKNYERYPGSDLDTTSKKVLYTNCTIANIILRITKAYIS